MKIGILGSGNIGGPLGRLWAQAGHAVLFSSRHPESLDALVAQAGPNAAAGSVGEAIAFADLLLEAIPYKAALELSPIELAGKTVISASNYYPQRDGSIDFDGLSQTELLARRLPDTKIVKAFNMMFAQEMEDRANGDFSNEIAIFCAGDDVDSRAIAVRLIRQALFEPVDAGALRNGRVFEQGGPLYAQRLTAAEAQERLDEALA